ncbi:hypothetical protein U8Z98_003817 [Stenotrophomonas maltophilia]|uniref:Uncharacterized protein n=1 Tax=Stenotrophomonas maltophilia TaxID=40324 RepID=A0AAI9G4V7_STEMA|nr:MULTISPECIES: hypothetical protein [Stenotrophomonas]EKZ1927419.1 hypothetical protein [Stenotrophomonas maltophilia]EMB2747362.1 hypothetical protein [Stenotrophomonas maltophilia]KRG42096.1 hypothetical protein ARC63_11730 [Stenotrophomonas geniculata ATCC 19374 = JCM 13324]MBA0283763.1 hypothetical protein [Stenotrophomonas maltophilia]MBA0324070.1 hypothetical protein [Stenotrophomonas maltophilia]
MAKPRTAPPSAPKPVQDGKPADVPAVTEEKAADASPAQGGWVPEEGRGELQPAETVASEVDGAAVDQPPGDQSVADQDAGAEAGTPSGDASTSFDAVATGDHSTDPALSNGLWLSACFEVLSPFKHNDVVVKPPAWIEMTWEEAQAYQDAGVLGDEPATPEELE